MKIYIFSISSEIALRWMPLDLTNDQTIDIGSGNGCIRQQAITWANVDQVPWHYNVSLGHNELKV